MMAPRRLVDSSAWAQAGVERLARALNALTSRIGADASDSDEVRVRRRMLLATSYLILPAAILWGAIYLAFDEPAAAAIPWGYATLSGSSIVVFWLTSRLALFRFTQLFLILLLPFALMWALGGFVNGSAVIFWSLLAPLGALLFSSRRHAVAWLAGFFLLLTVSAFVEPLTIDDNNLPRWVIIVFFALNVAAVSAIVFGLFRYFLNLREQEQDKSQRLLLNVLPAEIAGILREGGRTIADHHEVASVLFADVVGSTELAVRLSPENLVELLNEVFSHFDTLVEQYNLEKIRTIGDNYMVKQLFPRSGRTMRKRWRVWRLRYWITYSNGRRGTANPFSSVLTSAQGQRSPAWWAPRRSSTISGETT